MTFYYINKIHKTRPWDKSFNKKNHNNPDIVKANDDTIQRTNNKTAINQLTDTSYQMKHREPFDAVTRYSLSDRVSMICPMRDTYHLRQRLHGTGSVRNRYEIGTDKPYVYTGPGGTKWVHL